MLKILIAFLFFLSGSSGVADTCPPPQAQGRSLRDLQRAAISNGLGCLAVSGQAPYQLSCMAGMFDGFFVKGLGQSVSSIYGVAKTGVRETGRMFISGMPNGENFLRSMGIRSTQDMMMEGVDRYGPHVKDALAFALKFQSDPAFRMSTSISMIVALYQAAGAELADLSQIPCTELINSICSLSGELSFEAAAILASGLLTIEAGGAGGAARMVVALRSLKSKSPRIASALLKLQNSITFSLTRANFQALGLRPMQVLQGREAALRLGVSGSISNITSLRRKIESGFRVASGGLGRSTLYAHNYVKAPIDDVIKKLVGSQPIIEVTQSGKIYYRNVESGVAVVQDVAGKYFRIMNTRGSGRRVYLNLDGEIPNNRLDVTRNRWIGVTQSEYNALTHFSY